MKYFLASLIAVMMLFPVFASEKEKTLDKKDTRQIKVYGDWEAFMLGIDTPEKAALIKMHYKRMPKIALVGSSGLKASELSGRLKNNSRIKYIVGSEKTCKSMCYSCSSGYPRSGCFFASRRCESGYGSSHGFRILHGRRRGCTRNQ